VIRQEEVTFAALVDTLLAPAPPLPPVDQTDAVPAFERWLAAAPPVNRAALRAILLALAALRFPRRPPAQRLTLVRRLLGGELLAAVRAAAGLCYYGDPGVSRLLGYDP
jgi:hypothetical protein